MVSTAFSLSRVAAVLLLAVFIFAKPSEIFAKGEERQEVIESVDFLGTKVFRTSYGKQTDASLQGLTAVHPNSKEFKSRDQIIEGKWREIFVTPARVYVRNEWDEPYQYIPVERTKRGWSTGKPVPTPYKTIRAAQSNPTPAFVRKPVWLGERAIPGDSTDTVDILGEAGAPTITLDRVVRAGLPTCVAMLSDTTLGAYFLDDAGNKLFGVMDRSGRFLGPPLPKVEAFTPFSDFFSGGDAPYQLFAVALDDTGKRFLPLTIEGLLPVETQRVKSYQPLDFVSGGQVTRFGKRIHAWLKEYDENGVTYWGWCSPDLIRQTGPIWRSIEPREIYGKRYFLARLRDGSWMTYEPNDETGKWGVRFFMPHPMREKPEPEMATVLADVGSRFIDRRLEQLKDPIFNQKIVSTPASHYTYATDLAKYSPHLKGKAELLETAIYRQDWIEGERIARELGGDYWTRYIVARRWHNGPIVAAYWYQLMTQTQDEKLRAQVEQIYTEKAAGDARYFAEQARQRQAAIDQQRANEYEDRRAAKAWMLAGGGLKLPSENKPTSAERTATVNRYFSDLDKYQRGQQTWEPPVPTVLGK